MSNSSAPQSRCLFCTTLTGKRTREHIWRRSLRQRFTSAKSLTFWDTYHGMRPVSTRPISQFDMVLNAVCTDCNSGWLNDLEDRALPSLDFFGRGVGKIPTRTELDDLAFWSVIRALLRTHYSPAGRAPNYLFETVYANRQVRLIPAGCAVSIASTSHVDMEAGMHQSVRISEGYVGHVSIAFGTLFISTTLGGPDSHTSSLVGNAVRQVNDWFPDTFWQLAPEFKPPRTRKPNSLSASEARVAGSSLGFMLGLLPCDQFGNPLDLRAVVEVDRIGEVPWGIFTNIRR